MSLYNLFKIALRSLSRNKLRSFLTMLGLIIGVGSVIAMLAIGEGSKENIKEQISSLGNNVIMIIPGSSSQGGVRTDAGTSPKLTLDDAKAISERCPALLYTSPVVQTRSQIIAGSQNWRTLIYGAYTDYFSIRNLNVYSGNLFTKTEERNSAKVCLLGQTVIDNLFGANTDPVGQFIRINNVPFKVIGVLEKKGQSTFGQDQDDIIIAPFSTVQKRILSITNVHIILASAKSEDVIDEATEEITQVLREKHKITASEEDDFFIRTQSEISNIISSTAKILSILLASIASISLVVGGIGIMNIMLVSVTERTHEIGLRMAVGAKGRDVLLQFLIEAILLSLIGGLIGVIFGISVSELVANAIGWPISLSPNSILLSFLFSSAIGIFFGWYPARKAAKLNPIDALRYE